MNGTATMRAMIELGLTDEQKLVLLAAIDADAGPSRSTGAERQRRYRQRCKADENVTSDVTPLRNKRDVTHPPYEDTSTPQPATTGASAPSVAVSARVVFACPDGVDPNHWRDFLANRKRRSLAKTETAYQGILSDLARIADDEWPPGRLVQHAAAKGWGSINDPRTSLGNHRNGNQRTNGLRGSRPDPGLDLMRQGLAEERAERGQAADRGAWPALPALGASGP